MMVVLSSLVSCETTANSRKAGGAAFSDSYLGRQLDANAPLRDPDSPAAQSFEQFRETDLQ